MPGHIALRRMRLSALAQAGRGVAGDSPAAKPELAVDDMKVYALREPVSRRSYTVLEVHTKGGLTGWGECSAASSEALALAKQTTQGQAATSYEVISRQLAVYPGMQAAVVMALLDITGKYAKAPVYQTLGGPTRNKARALTPLSGATDAELAASMKRARGAGHRAFLCPRPLPRRRPTRARHSSGPLTPGSKACAPRADPTWISFSTAAGGLTPGDSASLAAALETLSPALVRRALPHLEHLDAAQDRRRDPSRRSGSDAVSTRAAAFQDLLRDQVIDVLRPSLALNGTFAIAAHGGAGRNLLHRDRALSRRRPDLRPRRRCTWPRACRISSSNRSRSPKRREDRAMRASLGGASSKNPWMAFCPCPPVRVWA